MLDFWKCLVKFCNCFKKSSCLLFGAYISIIYIKYDTNQIFKYISRINVVLLLSAHKYIISSIICLIFLEILYFGNT